MIRISLTLLVLLFVAPSVVSQVPDDKLIVPGQRIGKWTLEMTFDDLVRMNGIAFIVMGPTGQPLSPGDDVRNELIQRTWPDLALIAAHRRNQTRIAYLAISDRSFSTAKDIGVRYNDTREKVMDAYGAPTAETTVFASSLSGRAMATRMIYDDIGIAFRFGPDAGGRPRFLQSIHVFRPKDGREIWKF